MNNKSQSSYFILSVGLVLSFARFFLRTSPNLHLIMAVINIIAFNFVIFELIKNIYQKYFLKIEKSGFAERKQKIYKTKYIRAYRIFQIILFFILSPLYVRYHCETSNDILAILALFISIASPSISYTLSNIMYKKI